MRSCYNRALDALVARLTAHSRRVVRSLAIPRGKWRVGDSELEKL